MDSSARRAKRALDVVSALVGLVLLVPLLPIVALAVRFESPGPVLCRVRRLGVQRRSDPTDSSGGRRLHDVHGRLFTCRRFRVLGEVVRAPRRPRGEHPRLTRVGFLLRRTGLEHLPQMWNVLRGHMSLVGPRPSTPHFVAQVAQVCPSFARRLTAVQPGVFGMPRRGDADETDAHLDVVERMLFDLHYASRLATAGPWQLLGLDLSIAARCLLRSMFHGRPIGNDVVRLDYPRRFVHLPLDTLALARSAPPGVGSEVTESGSTITAWWYPPRRRGLELPPPGDSVVAHLCDEFSSSADNEAVFVCRLKPVATRGCDIVRVEMSSGLDDAHRVLAHLERLWEALASRSDDEVFVDRMTFLAASALATVAGGVADAHRRLAASIEIDGTEVRLRIEVVEDDTRPAALEPLRTRLAAVLRSAGEVPVGT